jgi:hypothetical protein
MHASGTLRLDLLKLANAENSALSLLPTVTRENDKLIATNVFFSSSFLPLRRRPHSAVRRFAVWRQLSLAN